MCFAFQAAGATVTTTASQHEYNLLARGQCALGLQGLLDHQPRGLAHDSPRIDVLAAEHLFKTLARCFAGRYLLHRDAPVSGLNRTPPSVQSIG